MDIKKKIAELRRKAQESFQKAELLLTADEPNVDEAKSLRTAGEGLLAQAEELTKIVEHQAALAAPVRNLPFPDSGSGDDDADQNPVRSALRTLRYGNVEEHRSTLLQEAYEEQDYHGLLEEQRRAFMRYLRTGQPSRVLGRQLWAPDDILTMLRDGVSMSEVRATMVEGTDVLGGFAVPPDVASAILQRMKGLTAVRDAGALVVETSSKVIEWLKISGPSSGSRYPSAMSGAWGSETQSPSAKNFELGLMQIPVHVYTYKTPMSASLIEDASNLVQVFVNLVSDTLAIDEDEAFLIGDGSGKPKGILADSANGRSLSAVNSGDASALTLAGLRSLKRGVASQYRVRGRASLVGNSDTGADIELFTDGTGAYYFEDLEPGVTRVVGGVWRESEAMPDVASSAYPLIYGDFSGYAIVERLGLAIQRYNDSNTGINVVEFHVRRRIGGDVIEPWKFAVQYVSA